MSFDVAADAYDRFMGRYSRLLAPRFADFAGVQPGMRVLDVGCGPGALTTELVTCVGTDNIVAIDPSDSFVTAARERHPGVDVQLAPAEAIPFATASFDASVAQLVVHFMSDPVVGLTEMRRVTRPGGVVAACVWDLAGGRAPLSLFWEAARSINPEAADESRLAGAREGHLVELFEAAGLSGVESAALEVTLEHPSFEEWWEPYTAGVGPAGVYVARLTHEEQAELRDRCRSLLPEPPFTLTSCAWATRGEA